MRKIYAILVLLLCTAALWAEVSFSGYAGIKGDFYSSKQDTFDSALCFQTYFAGQLNITKRFLIRTEFSMQTSDIAEKGPFVSTNASFCIDELSATYIKPFLGNVQYFNLFLGTYEPIGSDIFLQRQFGIQSFTSLITESWLGLKGSTAYPFYGAGGSYILHFGGLPIATGAFLYVNKENSDNERQLNLDWRFGTVWPWLALDFAIGIGAPMGTKRGDEDVILLIDTLYMHTGLTMLLGNKYSTSLFFQGGFSNLPLHAGEDSNKIESRDIYLLIEPRFVTRKFQTHVTFFSVPENTVEKMIFVDNTLGMNLSIFTDDLYIKNMNFTFGFHVTWTVTDKVTDSTVAQNVNKNFLDLKEPLSIIKDCDHHIKISPFVAFPLSSGTIHAMLQARITDLKSDSWANAFKLSVGYKARL
ncbi:MAG: hypothetical protein IJS09_11615 [Treponema sp.]|nr:hypothetical protein [Treponema sp.]